MLAPENYPKLFLGLLTIISCCFGLFDRLKKEWTSYTTTN